MNTAQIISEGRAVLGIEFGSTRIKAVLIDENNNPIASGSHDWENRLENNIWTYTEDDIIKGLQSCYGSLKDDVKEKYNVNVKKLKALGFSGMMHGYIALDENNKMLVPFRTWRNTITGQATEMLTKMFNFHIPQRWSIAHLGQAVLNGEEHVGKIKHLTTLAGYIHLLLTGEKVLGIGEASGMFPIDSSSDNYNADMMKLFDEFMDSRNIHIKLGDILPKVLTAGSRAGVLTQAGAELLDVSGDLEAGVVLCPPEGDAGTGMTATDSVDIRTGNVSAGTSVFAMVVLEKNLKSVHEELDIVTTPEGKNVAMVHCNNCTSDINAWVSIFKEFAELANIGLTGDEIYPMLFKAALEGEKDCGGIMAFNYFSGEHITGFDEGRPLVVRTPDSRFSLANFMRTHLYTALGALKVGLDILVKEEQVAIDRITGHGGFFKTPEVGQKILAAAMNTPVTTLKTAGEGGAWGIALLASYMINKNENESLTEYLHREVFTEGEGITVNPDADDVKGYDAFMEKYKKALAVEKAAVENI